MRFTGSILEQRRHGDRQRFGNGKELFHGYTKGPGRAFYLGKIGPGNANLVRKRLLRQPPQLPVILDFQPEFDISADMFLTFYARSDGVSLPLYVVAVLFPFFDEIENH